MENKKIKKKRKTKIEMYFVGKIFTLTDFKEEVENYFNAL